MSDRLASFLYRWRIPLSLSILIGALALAPRINVTEIDNDIGAWFSRQDPVFQEYERFRREFGGTRSLIVAIQGERLLTRSTLEVLRDLTDEIERIPTVQRVQSLANATTVRAVRASEVAPPREGDALGTADLEANAGENDKVDSLEVRTLLEDLERETEETIQERILGDPLIRGDLVSDDGDVIAVVVTFDEDRIDQVRAGIIERIHQIVDPRLPAGVHAYYNGSLEISETYNRVTVANTRRLAPLILLTTVISIYALFRSIRKTLLTTIAIAISVSWTYALYSLMGFSVNVLTSMLIPLIVVLAIADDVHIVQHYDHERRASGSSERAFKSTVSHLMVPLLGASGTTALGMLSLATSDVLAVRRFGIGAAAGVMVDFVISIVFVPTVLGLMRLEPRVPPQERYLVGPLIRIARFATAHPVMIAVAGLAISAGACLGILKLRVDTNHINFFSKNHPLHQSADVIDRKLSGVYSFQIFLEGNEGSLKSPDVLRRMEAVQAEIGRLPYVRKVTSIADYLKRVNQELNHGAAGAAVIPQSRELVAQELFVLSLGDAGRQELERMVSSDYSRGQISVKLASMSSDLVFEQIHEAERLAREAFHGTGIATTVTGSGRLFSTLDHYLVMSQLSSFGTAFLTVFGVIFVVFRSARFGLLAIVSNLFPVLAVLGIMGWLGISLNIATVMLASVALGVVDDDTIHFISRYRRETGNGRGTQEAIEVAAKHEGRASLTTALINLCGCSVLMFSEYKPTAWFGGLLGLTMIVAFLAEVFVVPATIKLAPALFAAEPITSRRATLGKTRVS